MILEKVNRVIIIRSFQILVQQLYSYRVVFSDFLLEEIIILILEFVTLANICEVTSMKSLIAKQVKGLILANTSINGYYISLQHITSIISLPQEYLVRSVFTTTIVKEFFHYNNSQFINIVKEDLYFSTNLLKVIKATFKSFTHTKHGITFKDPLNRERTELRFN